MVAFAGEGVQPLRSKGCCWCCSCSRANSSRLDGVDDDEELLRSPVGIREDHSGGAMEGQRRYRVVSCGQKKAEEGREQAAAQGGKRGQKPGLEEAPGWLCGWDGGGRRRRGHEWSHASRVRGGR